jgi:CubicO group peptidase (beta-lactamase class C family)
MQQDRLMNTAEQFAISNEDILLPAKEAVESPVPMYEIQRVMDEAVEEGVFPGASLAVKKHDQILLHYSCGHNLFPSWKPVGDEKGGATTSSGEIAPNSIKRPINIEYKEIAHDTVFDLASLTIGLVTTTIIMRLIDAERISLDERVSRYIDGFSVNGKARITLRHLLGSTSGLPEWAPFVQDLIKENAAGRVGIFTTRAAKDFVYNQINKSPVRVEPGTRYQPSDVGFIVLGNLIEALTGQPLNKAFHNIVVRPLNLTHSSFIDLTLVRRGAIEPCVDYIAPTEECQWRHRLLCGEVHDDNAWAMGGVAGHAGLFSNAKDVLTIMSALRDAVTGKNARFITPGTARSVLASPTRFFDLAVYYHRYGAEKPRSESLGWENPSRENGLYTSGLSASAFGNNSFTGCSAWSDPERGLDIVLLSNRISPTRKNTKIINFRSELIQRIVRTTDSLHP